MKLQLLITQYNETEDVIRPMLESISTQQGVDFEKDIEVVIANDGSDVKLSGDFLGSFSYPIRYIRCEHSGLPGCRAHLLDAATAEYVMFCDADDMFLSNLALYTILALAEKGFDALVCDFMEEVQDTKTRRSGFFPHKRDQTFVHGKVYTDAPVRDGVRRHCRKAGHLQKYRENLLPPERSGRSRRQARR